MTTITPKLRAQLHKTLDAILDFDTDAYDDEADYSCADGHRQQCIRHINRTLEHMKDPFRPMRELGWTEKDIEESKVAFREKAAEPKKPQKPTRVRKRGSVE